MSEILERVKKIVAVTLDIDETKVTESAHLVDDLGADSLARVELVMKLEEEFNIEIPDKDSEQITNVQAIAAYVESKQA
ncbi:MAG: acyl carrier protein [Proteobacteria bacterium]|nr:acyl carrier protein [Pseudomonadota bacterium]